MDLEKRAQELKKNYEIFLGTPSPFNRSIYEAESRRFEEDFPEHNWIKIAPPRTREEIKKILAKPPIVGHAELVRKYHTMWEKLGGDSREESYNHMRIFFESRYPGQDWKKIAPETKEREMM